ncbi:molybdopterin-dependent oxidoreductase [Leisingera aquaemixtae]|uniref:molybdopterin-dependent oxidoreductase n=1 Tax=Leisingera aquaemixtae TaxID=1396826 RepID=UPI001C97222C|nr:molybdopterin-dependent oxidoreductase [Leisingera aquaemixtae]MBY6068413.1 molybdopterin-dependent oxidoreductase [Leisingera aquaemixtae]
MLHIALKTIAICLLAAQPLAAENLGQPSGEVVLTVSGAPKTDNAGGAAQFDLAMLEGLGAVEFETSTIWTQGVQHFEGVPLDQLVDRLDITGTTLRATAINDYAVDIPLSDAVEGGPIIAYKLNGEEMSVRDKGPLWIVYPYDSKTEYQSEVVYSRSIWQLDRIEVIE